VSLLGRLRFNIPSRTPGDFSPAAVADVLVPDPRTSSDERDVTHLLVYNDPEAFEPSYPPGWTLFAGRGDGRQAWRESLAAHGAGSQARSRVAKAVAVRMLSGRGLIVEGWVDHRPGVLAETYRAVLAR
jgi:hypothetical protein